MSHALTVTRPERGPALPAIITREGRKATKRFLEFFTANIRNPNTRVSYMRAIGPFLAWCEEHGASLHQIEPVIVAAYIERLTRERAPQTVKQHLAAIRMLFDWLVTGQIVPFNPAASVRGPRYSIRKGKTPVLSAQETRKLLDSIDTSHVVGLRDRALIGTMVYSFARVSAVVNMRVRYKMIQRKAEDAGISSDIACHTFRATGITEYLRNGGTIEYAQQIAAHESPRTTKLYDRTNDAISLDEIERIVI